MGSITFITQLFRDMRMQKMRTLLTMFGIIWGTAAVILLLAFGEGIHMNQVKALRGLGEFIVIMWPGRTSMEYEGMPRNRQLGFKEEDAEYLKTLPHMGLISPEYTQWNVMARVGKINKRVSVTGCWPEYATIRNVIPRQDSRFINEEDMELRRRIIFLGTDIAEELFPRSDAVGEYVQINGMPFMVVGVMKRKEQDSSYKGRDTKATFIPTTTLKTMFGREYLNNMVFKADDPNNTPFVVGEVRKALGRKLKFNPDDEQALSIWDTSENEAFFFTLFTAFRGFLGIIGVFTLLVGGIGISNIMNVVVEERTKEIGTKMALGAKKRFVRTQMLLETLLLTGIGGLIGFAFSCAVISVFPYFGAEEHVGTPQFSPLVAITTIVVLTIIGLIAGFIPARRASNLNPVEAIRL